MKNKALNRMNETFKDGLKKDRLRALLWYKGAKETLENATVSDIKRHVYKKNGEDRLVRYRLELESMGKIIQMTQFQILKGKKPFRKSWNVNGKLDPEDGEIKGQTLEETFSLSSSGALFLNKFLEKLNVPEMEKELRKIVVKKEQN